MLRYFLFISLLGISGTSGFSADSGFEFFPRSIELIGKLDVSSTLGIAELKNVINEDPQDEDIAKLIELGLNPFVDIEDAYFGILQKEGEKEPGLLAVLRYNRKIDLAKVIRGYAEWKSESLVEQSHGGVSFFGVEAEDGSLYVTPQLKGEWSFIGSLETVKSAIDRFNGTGDTVIQNKALMTACQGGMLPHLLWVAGNIRTAGPGMAYNNVLFTMDYINGIQISGRLPYTTEEEKMQINQTLSMASGLLMMLSQGKMNTGDFKISEDKGAVSFRLMLTEDLLVSLKDQAEMMQKETGGPPTHKD